MKLKRIKAGMTNDSHVLVLDNQTVVVRLPGKGTENLINRAQEQQVYKTIAPLKISDKVLFLDPDNGYKITKFLKNAATCDKYNWAQVTACMDKLKILHNAKLSVDFSFDIAERIGFYQGLMNQSAYTDHQQVTEQVLSLQGYLTPTEQVLCHIDSVPDNFLFHGKKQNKIKLIDWEYAAMQDPLVDLAMWIIYAMYERSDADRLIACYGIADDKQRYRVYAYVAMCGLLWSNWCEYKATLGVDFGEYALAQYAYARDYYAIFMNEWGRHV